MAHGDGNGWVDCRCGSRHWGRFGAAGLLLLDATETVPRVLLQLRAGWTHEGGSWSLVGGARDSHEDEVTAALREAAEEAGIRPELVRVLGSVVGLDHRDWRYTYVVALALRRVTVSVLTQESVELRWVEIARAEALALHRGLGEAWAGLRTTIDRAVTTGSL